jgi:hypothetical protein
MAETLVKPRHASRTPTAGDFGQWTAGLSRRPIALRRGACILRDQCTRYVSLAVSPGLYP